MTGQRRAAICDHQYLSGRSPRLEDAQTQHAPDNLEKMAQYVALSTEVVDKSAGSISIKGLLPKYC